MGYKTWQNLNPCIDPSAWNYAKEMAPKPNKPSQTGKSSNQNSGQNPNQKMCTTYNTFRKEGCSYEHSNPGENCIYIHACSTCRQKGLGLKRHKAHQCTETKGTSVPANSAPPPPAVHTPVTSVQQLTETVHLPFSESPVYLKGENSESITLSSLKDDVSDLPSYPHSSTLIDFTPAKPDIAKGTFLKPCYFVLNDGSVFIDKLLPKNDSYFLRKWPKFDSKYFIDLNMRVSVHNNYNHLGARVPLVHSNLNVNKFRQLLPEQFEDLAILQYMEYGSHWAWQKILISNLC